MTILTFTGEDSAAAMEKMADQLVENCFIVSTAKRGNQIEISATDNPPASFMAPPPAFRHPWEPAPKSKTGWRT